MPAQNKKDILKRARNLSLFQQMLKYNIINVRKMSDAITHTLYCKLSSETTKTF